jgi:hypothetical protein
MPDRVRWGEEGAVYCMGGGMWGEKRTFVGFEVVTPVVINSSIFWDITPHSPLRVNRHFRGTCRLHRLATCFSLVSCLAYSSTTKMEATCPSEMSANFQDITWHYVPEDRTLQGTFGLPVQPLLHICYCYTLTEWGNLQSLVVYLWDFTLCDLFLEHNYEINWGEPVHNRYRHGLHKECMHSTLLFP